jgi:predicted GH43/DUF377 family glycosyl hydrolase
MGVFNPGCFQVGDITHLFYRALNSKMISSIGYCQLKDNQIIQRLNHPILYPEYDYERIGVEDPRITYLDGTYYLFYTVFDGKNALVAYATSPDLIHFTKKEVISPKITYDEAEDIFSPSIVKTDLWEKYKFFEKRFMKLSGPDVLLWEKDACLFPKKINGKFALLHRILPGIQVIFFNDFSELTENFWRKYLRAFHESIILEPKFLYENRNVGGGCPPIETQVGWLLIYHAVENTDEGKVYHASAALLDLNDPTKVLGRLEKPLFSPLANWEKTGVTHNVVFPSGTVLANDKLTIYYGAADTLIAAKSVSFKDLLRELISQKV